jgi:hypothetical protein
MPDAIIIRGLRGHLEALAIIYLLVVRQLGPLASMHTISNRREVFPVTNAVYASPLCNKQECRTPYMTLNR